MKKLAGLLIFLFCLSFSGTAAAFKEDPVAVVILDYSYLGVDQELWQTWEERVKRRFRFPDYKLLGQKEVKDALRGSLPVPDKKRPSFKKPQLEAITQTIPAELVVVIWVDRMQEEVYHSLRFMGETVRRVEVSIDVTAYRKTDDKYLAEKIRYYSVDNIAISTPARTVATDKIAEAIDKFKEQLPRLEKEEEAAVK